MTAPSRMLRAGPLVAVCALLFLAGCGAYEAQPSQPAHPCPPLKMYSEAEQQRAADEIGELSPGAMLRTMMDDYLLLRDQCRESG